MSGYQMPFRVRLELDHIKMTVLHALSDAQEGLGKEVAMALERAIAELNIDEEARKAVRAVAPDMFRKAVESAMYDVLYDPDVKAKLREALAKEITKPTP